MVEMPDISTTFKLAVGLAVISLIGALNIDNELKVIRSDCFERLAIGHRLNGKDVYNTVEVKTVPDCQKECTNDGDDCKSFSFGIGVKGNASCELSSKTVKETVDLQPIGTQPDPEYDLYIKKLGCKLVIEQKPETNHHEEPSTSKTPTHQGDSYVQMQYSPAYNYKALKPSKYGPEAIFRPDSTFRPSTSKFVDKYHVQTTLLSIRPDPKRPSFTGLGNGVGYNDGRQKGDYGYDHEYKPRPIYDDYRRPEHFYNDRRYGYNRPYHHPNDMYERPYRPIPIDERNDYYEGTFRPKPHFRPSSPDYDNGPTGYSNEIPKPEFDRKKPFRDRYPYPDRPDDGDRLHLNLDRIEKYRPELTKGSTVRPPFERPEEGSSLERPSTKPLQVGYDEKPYLERPRPTYDRPEYVRPFFEYGMRPEALEGSLGPAYPRPPPDGPAYARPERPPPEGPSYSRPTGPAYPRPPPDGPGYSRPPSDGPGYHRPLPERPGYSPDGPSYPRPPPEGPSYMRPDYARPPPDEPPPGYARPPPHGPPSGYARPDGPPPGYARPHLDGPPPGHSRPPPDEPPPGYARPPPHGPPPGYARPPSDGPPSGYARPPPDGPPPEHSRPPPDGPPTGYARPHPPPPEYARPRPEGPAYMRPLHDAPPYARPPLEEPPYMRPSYMRPPPDGYDDPPMQIDRPAPYFDRPPPDYMRPYPEFEIDRHRPPSYDFKGERRPADPNNPNAQEFDRPPNGGNRRGDYKDENKGTKLTNTTSPNQLDDSKKPHDPHDKTRPIVSHSVGPKGEQITSIITELESTCFRRALAGKRVTSSLVKRAMPCERIEDCQQECAQERRFNCEVFNYRLDPSGRGNGDCELIGLPLVRIDMVRDVYTDRDYDVYERDRNGAPDCKGYRPPPFGVNRYPPEQRRRGDYDRFDDDRRYGRPPPPPPPPEYDRRSDYYDRRPGVDVLLPPRMDFEFRPWNKSDFEINVLIDPELIRVESDE